VQHCSRVGIGGLHSLMWFITVIKQGKEEKKKKLELREKIKNAGGRNRKKASMSGRGFWWGGYDRTKL